MRIATWNIGEDERNTGNKLDINSYEYIVNTIKKRKHRCDMFSRSN